MTSLVHNLLILQQTLYERNSDTAGILKKESEIKTGDSDEDIPSDDEDNEGGNKRDNEVNGERKDDGEDSLKLSRKRKQSMVSSW